MIVNLMRIMKLLFTLLLLPLLTFAQKRNYIIMPSNEFVSSHDSILHKIFPFKDSKVYYELVIDADTLKKNDLFERAKIWQVKMFNSPKTSQQFQDKESGFIALKTNFSEPYRDPLGKTSSDSIINLSFIFSLKIYLKNYKAKIVIDNINMLGINLEEEPIETHFLTQTRKEDDIISELPKRLQRQFNNYAEREKELTSWNKTYRYANIEFKSIMENFKNAILSKSESDF